MKESKPLDDFMYQYNLDEAARAKTLEQLEPILDGHAWKIYKLDRSIEFYENKKVEIEKEKMKALNNFSEILDTAMVASHTIKKNGYSIKPDNKLDLKITSMVDFFRWLKANKSPLEVMTFLEKAIKKTELKKFCEIEFNKQKLAGEMTPEIQGINFGEVTFRKLKTEMKKGEKNGNESRPVRRHVRQRRKS